MEPFLSDLLQLGDTLVKAFDRAGLGQLGATFEFSFGLEIADGALRKQTSDMISEVVRRGDLNKLLDNGRKLRPDKADLADIAAHLEAQTNLTFPLRQRLRDLLPDGGVPPRKVRDFYNAARPRAVVLRGDANEAFDAAIALAKISPDAGVTPVEKYPILPFVERVAYFWEESDAGAATALIEWSGLAASLFKVSQPDAIAIRKNARETPVAAKVLLIQFHPLGEKYRLEAHLWTEGEEQTQVIECDEKPVAAAELPAAIGPVINCALNNDVDCTVELLAPIELLDQPFDAWKVAQKFPVRLGVLSPVAIRRYERARREDPQELQRWKKKWARLRDVDQPEFYWIGNATVDPGDVFTDLLPDDSPPCVALSFAPTAADVSGIVDAALTAGAPVLVWVRDTKAAGIRKEIEAALKDVHGAPSLPRLIRTYRTKRSPAPHSNDFTLFYDCPERLLPQSQQQLGIKTTT